MPLFVYQAYTAEGARVSRREQAPSTQALRTRVKESGLYLKGGSIREQRSWLHDPRRVRLSTTEVIDLFQQLELQLGAGVLSDEAIRSMIESQGSRRSRWVLGEIHQAITNGRMSISEAFGLFPRTFPAALLAVIQAGERAGASELGKRFGDLRSRLEFYRMVRGITLRAFQYPAVVALLAVSFFVFVFTFLVPVLARVLETVNVKLPPLTQALVSASRFCNANWPLIVGAVVLLPVAWLCLRRIPGVALAIDRAVLRLPYIGTIYRSIACSLVFRTYASLYDAGEPAPEILLLCENLVRNRAMRAAIAEVRRRVLLGDPLHGAFQRTRCFPPDACAMVKTGESAGLGESMRLSAEHHAGYARDRIAFAVSWLEPLAIVVMGLFVGLIAYAFFTPVMSIYEGIR